MRIAVGMIGLRHPHSAGHLRTLDALERVEDVILYDDDPAARASGRALCRKTRAVEADLAAHDPETACAAAAPLADPAALRAQRFVAWRALVACSRRDDAARLASELGITR
jgi:hypothetical protein